MMYKESDWRTYVPAAGSIIGTIAGYLGANAVSKGFNRALREEVDRVNRGLPTNRTLQERMVGEIKVEAGLPDLPHRIYKNFDNAVYIPPNSVSRPVEERYHKEIKKRLGSNDKNISESGKFLQDVIDFSKSKDGGIIVGERFSNPFVVGHEIGHAMIEKEKGAANFFQKNFNTITNLGILGAGAGLASKAYGSIAGSQTASDIGNILSLTSLGTLGAAGLGRLYYEGAASDRALDIMKKKEEHRKNMEDYKRLKDVSLNTYLASPISLAMTAGGGYLGHLLGENLKGAL